MHCGVPFETAQFGGICGTRFYVLLFCNFRRDLEFEFAFVFAFVSVLFAFAECGMWNVECGDGGIFINPTRVCKFRKGKLLLRGWQLTQQTHLSRSKPFNDAAGNS